jgi:hypothetical protein
MALLWCCAERQLDEGAKLGQRTCGAHVPFLGHVHILLDSYTEFRVVYMSASEQGLHLERLTPNGIFRFGVPLVGCPSTPQISLVVRLLQDTL